MIIQRSRVVAWIVGALMLMAPCAFAAPQSILTPDGVLYLVEETTHGNSSDPVALRWREVGAHGVRGGGVIPSTAGPELDAYPALTLDPDTGNPALVWSHFTGSDFDLVLSVHDGTRWSDPISLVATAADEIQAVAFPAPGEGLHVLWRVAGEADEFWYGLFRTGTGVAVIGPERVLPGSIPGFGSTEGGVDEPGIQPGDCQGTTCVSGGTAPSKTCSPGGMCKESTIISSEPVTGAVSCRTVSVAVPVGDSICLVSRDEQGWSAGPCAPKGAVDFRRAVEARGQAACE